MHAAGQVVSGAVSRQLVAPPRGGTWLGVYPEAHPPAQTDPLARGKPGIDVAFLSLSLGAQSLTAETNNVPAPPAMCAHARPAGSSAGFRHCPFVIRFCPEGTQLYVGLEFNTPPGL